MKTNAKLGLVVAALSFLWLTTGMAGADFTLSGHEQLTVDMAQNAGALTDWSGVDIVQGGSVVTLHSNDNSTVKVTGGTVTGSVFARDSSTVIVSGGSVNRIYANKKAAIDMLGGTVDSIYSDHSSMVNISSGSVDYFLLRSWSSANISGGSVDLMGTPLFPVCEDASLTISGGRVEMLLLSLNLYGSKRLSITEDPYAAGFSLPGVDIAEGTVKKLSVKMSTFNTSVVDYSAGSKSGVLNTYGSSTVNLSGGVLGLLNAREESTVVFSGTDFVLDEGQSLDGQELLGTGFLSGKWLDGTPWSIKIDTNETGATILLIPEPSTLLLMAAGGLVVLRRRKCG